ncbi:MAG: helix-turn-helix domain-containing protein [Thermoleophilia bacterium]
MNVPTPEERPIALRAYAVPPDSKRNRETAGRDKQGGAPWSHSAWSLTLDIETTTTAGQRPRVGNYQLHYKGDLREEGFFYDPAALNSVEHRRLRDYTRRHDLALHTISEFNEQIFYSIAYRQNALIIGFNLPFDLARLAYHHQSAKGRKMGGGFTFALSDHWPHLRIKHLSRSAALIDFASPGGQRTARSGRRRNYRRRVRRGFFCDVRSLAAALTGSSHSLASLAGLLGTAHQKTEAEHGQELTAKYLRYLRNDVQVTFECFELLASRYESFKLSATPVSSIFSEASIGKACLREMAVKPWRELQPDVPPELIGIIMSSYFGGRSEVHLRRTTSQVAYCDFLSMYPTVSILMGLWRFVTATGIDWREATDETQALVDSIELSDLAKPATWTKLAVLVQVEADGDLLPVRSAYDDHSPAYSIGLNYLTAKEPLWFTLADVLVSKLLTGKSPTIRRALAFAPKGQQPGLKPIDILGKADYHIDPAREDFYRRLIELRSNVKRQMRGLPAGPERERLAAEQQAMKIAANASCYGIFVELNVQEYTRKREQVYFGGDEQARTTKLASIEEPGRYFHPLLATLTTGAARLMLAIVEALAEQEGLSWAFCDTDSMALACPSGMPEEEFRKRTQRVRGWFEQLNPYASGDELFKLEDANYNLDGQLPEALYCFAISDKRYALFNIDEDGRPVLRKASAHGLGYLLPPYPKEKAPVSIPAPRVSLSELGVERWQYDLWYRIVEAALDGHAQQVDCDDLPGFAAVAVSRYAATCPRLLHWFDTYNKGKPYAEQVCPFGFLNAYLARSAAQRNYADFLRYADDGRDGKHKRQAMSELPRAVSPFDPDPAVAVQQCFDRNTGKAVVPELLRTYRQAVARYHLHPETKFSGGDYTQTGSLHRRHLRVPDVNGIEYIGKEANRWEERSQTGEDSEAQIKYGVSGGSLAELRERVVAASEEFGVRAVARAAELSHSTLVRFVQGAGEPEAATVSRLQEALAQLSSDYSKTADAVLAAARELRQEVGLHELAARAGIDRANLRAVLSGRRTASPVMLSRLEAVSVRDAK